VRPGFTALEGVVVILPRLIPQFIPPARVLTKMLAALQGASPRRPRFADEGACVGVQFRKSLPFAYRQAYCEMLVTKGRMASFIGDILKSKLFWLVVLASIVAFFRLTVVESTTIDRPPLRADAGRYYFTAYNLRVNGIYSSSPGEFARPPVKVEPDAYLPPGVPLLIAAVTDEVANPWHVLARGQAANMALGVATVALIFLAAAAVLPLPAAIIVGLLVACSPHLVSFTIYVLSETPAAFLVAVLLAIAAIGIPSQRAARGTFFLGLGAIVGCLSLFRPVFLAFAPLLSLAFPDHRDKWRALVFGCLGAAIVVAPWFIRNALVVPQSDAPSLLASAMLEGSYPGFVYDGNKATFPYGGQRDPIFNETRKSVTRTLEVVARKIADNPVATTRWYLLEKPVFLLQWDNIDGVGDVFIYPVRSTPFNDNMLFKLVHGAFHYSHYVVLILAAIGAVTVWLLPETAQLAPNKQPVLRIASLLFVFLYLIHIPFVVSTRYSVPVFPVIYLLAAFAIVGLIFRLRQSPATK
jgi:4-amino-4-deoxy-L-arabinose transferase-like glycosyltransferase